MQIKYRGKYFTNPRNAVHVKIDEVQKMIDEVKEGILNDPEPFAFHYQSTGDVLVIGWRGDDEATIIVTQNYCEATLLKEGDNWTPVQYGNIAHLCPVCNGSGYIYHKYYIGSNGSENADKTICEACYGDGKIWT